MIVPGPQFADVTICVLPGPRTSIVRGNYVRGTSVKRRNKIVQKKKKKKKITRNVAIFFSVFIIIIAVENGF